MIAGTAYGETAPVESFSPIFYLGDTLEAGAEFPITDEHEERSVYVVERGASVNGESLAEGQMAVLKPGTSATVATSNGAKIMLAGGAPMDGDRLMW